MKKLLPLLLLLIVTVVLYLYFTKPVSSPASINKVIKTTVDTPSAITRQRAAEAQKVKVQAAALKAYAEKNGFNTTTCFLIDMSLPSGRARFFVYNLQADTVLAAGLVAHGSCNKRYLQHASFSNIPNTGCSSLGRYKVSYAYNGQFGKAYKLRGLDSSNNKAFERFVVLHAYSCVPDAEVDPMPICNSLGCPMVSYGFLKKLEPLIDGARRPILLWLYQ